MIKNYTLESILPPVLRKVMRRVVMLENQHQATIRLIDSLLEALSDQENVENSGRSVG